MKNQTEAIRQALKLRAHQVAKQQKPIEDAKRAVILADKALARQRQHEEEIGDENRTKSRKELAAAQHTKVIEDLVDKVLEVIDLTGDSPEKKAPNVKKSSSAKQPQSVKREIDFSKAADDLPAHPPLQHPKVPETERRPRTRKQLMAELSPVQHALVKPHGLVADKELFNRIAQEMNGAPPSAVKSAYAVEYRKQQTAKTRKVLDMDQIIRNHPAAIRRRAQPRE